MIDKQVFANYMGLLAGNFGREVDGAVSRLYYGVLSPHLTTEQFVDAMNRTMATETFWPAAAVILEKAGVSPHQRSEGALRMVSNALFEHGGYRFLPAEISTSWDAATWAAIREIGGLKEITLCTEERWPKLQAKFRRAYEAALAPAPALSAGGKPDPRVLKLVESTAKAMSRGGQDNALPAGDRE